jgi:hypothetical protein
MSSFIYIKEKTFRCFCYMTYTSYLYRKHKNGGSACSVWSNIYVRCSGSTKMEEAHVVLWSYIYVIYVCLVSRSNSVRLALTYTFEHAGGFP